MDARVKPGHDSGCFAAISAYRRKHMPALGVERQRIDTAHRGEWQFAVEMRKQRAAARGLPLQERAERIGIDRDQNEIALPGKLLCRGLSGLLGG